MLKDDLKIDLKLRMVFDYDFVKDENYKKAFEDQLWYLLNEPRFEGQVEIVKEIKWLFFTDSHIYNLVGIKDNDELWAMDEDGAR